MIFLISILSLILFSALSIIYYTFKNGIGPTPTSKKVLRTLIDNMPQINRGSIAVLGSGFGTIIVALSKRYPNIKIIGYENSLIVYLISKMISWRYPNIEIKKNNFFNHNIGGNKCLVCYLYPGAMEKLKNKLFKEFKDQIIIVTHTFAFSGLKENKLLYADDLYKTPIYFYELERKDVF